MLFRDEFPVLGQGAALDEGLGSTGVSKLPGSWVEMTGPISTVSADSWVYIAPYPLEIVKVQEVHRVASTSGTVTVEKLTGTTAPGSGTAVLASTLSTAGAANTVQSGTLATSIATRQLAAGDRLALVGGGTQTNLAGCVLAIQVMKI